MFIPILPYMSETKVITDKVLIYDTMDLTAEYVGLEALDKCGVNIFGLQESYDLFGEYVYSITTLYDYAEFNETDAAIRFVNNDPEHILLDNNVHVELKTPSKHSIGEYQPMLINGEHVCLSFSVYLMYIFRYKDYYIMRFKVNTVVAFKTVWFSVALDNKGKVFAYWSGKNNEVGMSKNSGFGTKIDTIMRY